MGKDVRIAVRVTAKEKEKIQTKARKCGLSTTEYIKQRALEYEPRAVSPDALFVCLEKLSELADKASSPELNKEICTVLKQITAEFLLPERRFPMAFVPVPKDLNRVKTKVMFNLTKRQLICFALAAAAGVPIFFLTKPSLGISTSAMLMVVIMLPFIFFALYEKDGQPAEKILGHVIKSMFLRDKVRPYRTSNLYAAIQQEIKEKEELQIAQQHEKGRRT